MVDSPLRSEPIFDPITKQFTVRYSEYFDSLQDSVNSAQVELESEISGALTQIQQVQSFTAVLEKMIGNIEAATVQVSNLRAEVAVLRSRVKDLEALV